MSSGRLEMPAFGEAGSVDEASGSQSFGPRLSICKSGLVEDGDDLPCKEFIEERNSRSRRFPGARRLAFLLDDLESTRFGGAPELAAGEVPHALEILDTFCDRLLRETPGVSVVAEDVHDRSIGEEEVNPWNRDVGDQVRTVVRQPGRRELRVKAPTRSQDPEDLSKCDGDVADVLEDRVRDRYIDGGRGERSFLDVIQHYATPRLLRESLLCVIHSLSVHVDSDRALRSLLKKGEEHASVTASDLQDCTIAKERFRGETGPERVAALDLVLEIGILKRGIRDISGRLESKDKPTERIERDAHALRDAKRPPAVSPGNHRGHQSSMVCAD